MKENKWNTQLCKTKVLLFTIIIWRTPDRANNYMYSLFLQVVAQLSFKEGSANRCCWISACLSRNCGTEEWRLPEVDLSTSSFRIPTSAMGANCPTSYTRNVKHSSKIFQNNQKRYDRNDTQRIEGWFCHIWRCSKRQLIWLSVLSMEIQLIDENTTGMIIDQWSSLHQPATWHGDTLFVLRQLLTVSGGRWKCA